MNISNIKIGKRLALAFGSMLLLLAVVTTVGILRLSSLDDKVHTIVENRFPKSIQPVPG